MKNRTSRLDGLVSSLGGSLYIYIALALSGAAFWVSWTNYFGYSRDYENYDYFFNLLRYRFSSFFNTHRFEPAFAMIARLLVAFVQSNEVVYALFVAPAVFLKVLLIGRWSKGYVFFALAVFLYFFRFFPLHELTQVRASSALVFIMFSLYYRVQNRLYLAAACGMTAFLFHYSSALVVPFLFLPELKAKEVILLGVSLFVGIYIFSFQIVPMAATYFTSIESTLRSVVDSEGLNPLSPLLYPEYFMILVSLLFWEGLTRAMKFITSMQVFGLAMGLSFFDFPVLAVRSHELYIFLWVFYVAQASYCRIEIKISSFLFSVAMSFLGIYVYYMSNFFIY